MSNVSNTECIQGWIEVLHCKHEAKDFHSITPQINPLHLKTLKEAHYTCVGSPIPLCEYYSAFELYQQFAGTVDLEFNVPRAFQSYDAINLCVNDPKFGSKITTLIVVPKGAHINISYKEQRVQYHPDNAHCLVIRKSPFKSFLAKK